jgi:hypothetical protein
VTETPDEDVRQTPPEEGGDDASGDPRDPAREAAGRQAADEGESREGERTATGEPDNAGADR